MLIQFLALNRNSNPTFGIIYIVLWAIETNQTENSHWVAHFGLKIINSIYG